MDAAERAAAVERVQSAMAAPALRGRERMTRGPSDPKFEIGECLLAVPPEDREAIGVAAGLTPAQVRVYTNVAEAWPSTSRRATSWTVHRDLSQATKLYDPADRFALITDGMDSRQSHIITHGGPKDRKAPKSYTDEQLADEIVQWLLDPRGRSRVIPIVEERLVVSAEGRKVVGARRASSLIKKLRNEIRLVQQEMKLYKEHGSPDQRYHDVKLRIIDVECHIDEADLLWQHDRHAISDENWIELGKRIEQLGHEGLRVARMILGKTDVMDTEGWDEAVREPLQLSSGFEDIEDAVIVSED